MSECEEPANVKWWITHAEFDNVMRSSSTFALATCWGEKFDFVEKHAEVGLGCCQGIRSRL